MGGIFICYRRKDAAHAAGRIRAALLRYYDAVFIDIDGIGPGGGITPAIEAGIGNASAFLVLIGSRWFEEGDDGSPRIGSQRDFVRIEIEHALKAEVPVIPILLDGAAQPDASELPKAIRELTELNFMELSHSRFDRDMAALVKALEKHQKFKNDAFPWQATFIEHTKKTFKIRLSRHDASHLLDFVVGGFGIDILRLDSHVIASWRFPGRKEVTFRVGEHSEEFRIKLRSTLRAKVKDIELWIDQRVLQSG